MGISLAWVAVEGLPLDQALQRLLLSRTGEACEFQHVDVSFHPLPQNWLLVTGMGCDHRVIRPESMSAVSAGCRAVACSVEEHVNFASTELWENGQRTWHVQHEGERDAENISHAGSPPQRLFDLLATVESGDSENLDGHFHMDIPLLLAKELAGFRHDEYNPDIDSTPFEKLANLAQKRPWWRFWK